jgi:hypothetical protein
MELSFRVLLAQPSMKALFFDELPRESNGAIIGSVDFIVCSVPLEIPRKWFATAQLEMLLRGGDFWPRLEENGRLMDRRSWENFLEKVRANNDRFRLIDYRVEEGDALVIYKRNGEK